MRQASYRIRAIYRTGTWAWLLHRVSGLLIVAYLYFHLIVLSSVVWPGGPRAFNRVVADLTTPPFIVADWALFTIIFFHALNGIRLLLLDLGWMVDQQKKLFWVAMGIGAVLLAGSVVAMLPQVRL
ncbi:succinate dehydrogenase, cytochrome b556 subunit [Sulfobacillus harzensis]|uniref:Succinate dehydrogenase, cytochrome b556 subunit n=1 Tax=Sulfobacillus harzensis TaxID=2729629 RepID=A0A7Y0L395_9FIRM|nr:succinate dehydrogenase, cytochrome b556 subunit [Sulfobacillus harzensis]NMP22493.1 succinate dehydrogenase, cytochrome b556 subunit [Sulfobacillus harzensis]